MPKSTRAYRAYADDTEPRMPERKRSHRARSESIERRQARAVKYAPAEVAR